MKKVSKFLYELYPVLLWLLLLWTVMSNELMYSVLALLMIINETIERKDR
jgi:hypothetical protein|nr:MAG TPA: hypothetical protein [Caudoviricetes sp.]